MIDAFIDCTICFVAFLAVTGLYEYVIDPLCEAVKEWLR